MSSRAGVGSGLPRRRNGKEQACEPCRKAKIACDHGLPVCSRCKRRKVAQNCVYLSAPMTRPAEHSRSHSASSNTGTVGVETHKRNQSYTFPPTPTHTVGSSGASPSSGSVSIYSALPSTAKPSDGPLSTPKSGGFFGPTSFGAVFSENRENLGSSGRELDIVNDHEPYKHPSESLQAEMYLLLAGNNRLALDESRVMLGARVLRSLPDHSTCKFLVNWYIDRCSDSPSYHKTVLAVFDSLWSTFAEELKEPRNGEDLQRVSAIICKNATVPLEESDGFNSWIDSFTGMNMRWEGIGGVFNALTSSLLSVQERDAFFTTQQGHKQDRRHFAVEMKDCLQACITLSNYMDYLNILMVACLSRNLVLQTVLSGDASLVCWRLLGDLVSATTAMGLHRQSYQGITFLSEFKKSLFCYVFSFDKATSLLTGRPPALGYRYTKFEIPLDLDDDVIIKGGKDLERAITRLDPNGWNTDGILYVSTRCRAHCLMAIILNEILELCLGEFSEPSADQIRHLLNKVEKTYASFPTIFRLDPNDPTHSEISDKVFWSRICARLYSLLLRLILERLGHKQGIFDGQSMVDCAREMLEHTVSLWVQRDRLVDHHCDYDWLVVCWGIPASGVLCVELLKQMKQPPGTPHTLKLPRSEIVQNLSLLVGFLEWIRPAAGNYQLCRRMALLIKRILDQILNPSPPSSHPPPLQDHQIQADGFDATGTTPGLHAFDPGFEIGEWEDGLDNLDWLNTIDWSTGPRRSDIAGQDFMAARMCY